MKYSKIQFVLAICLFGIGVASIKICVDKGSCLKLSDLSTKTRVIIKQLTEFDTEYELATLSSKLVSYLSNRKELYLETIEDLFGTETDPNAKQVNLTAAGQTNVSANNCYKRERRLLLLETKTRNVTECEDIYWSALKKRTSSMEGAIQRGNRIATKCAMVFFECSHQINMSVDTCITRELSNITELVTKFESDSQILMNTINAISHTDGYVHCYRKFRDNMTSVIADFHANVETCIA